MKVLGIEIKVTVKVEVTLLLPASPWPWSEQWTLLRIQHSGSTAGTCGDQEAGRPGQGTKPGLGLGFVPWPE